MIYPHHLEFMEEAKKAFESNPRFETYRNTAGNLLALRYGMDRNCIAIHEIGEEIGFFAEVMERAPELVVGVPTSNRFKPDSSFNARTELLARPDEWVLAYKDNSKWFKIAFCTDRMGLAFAPYDSLETVFASKGTEFYQLNNSIPIEDVPEEERT